VIAILLDHLWQSTLFALAAGLLTLMLRRNGARARYWLWFAASMKFLVPATPLVALGASPGASPAVPPERHIQIARLQGRRRQRLGRLRGRIRARTTGMAHNAPRFRREERWVDPAPTAVKAKWEASMSNRRTVLFSLFGTLAAAALPRAGHASQATPVSEAAPDTPKATVIKGKPPVLDFGEGVRVPCDKSAFLTLYEGPTYWLTFGVGRSHHSAQAQGQAVKYAKAAMKLLLMTLAFAPDRFEKIDGGGWRLKSRKIEDFVRGDVELPGNPFWPNTDAFLGFGDADAAALGSLDFGAIDPTGMPSASGMDITGSWSYVDSFSAYVVFKRDVTLDHVRAKAQVLPVD
jgi:hypothetical protein